MPRQDPWAASRSVRAGQQQVLGRNIFVFKIGTSLKARSSRSFAAFEAWLAQLRAGGLGQALNFR